MTRMAVEACTASLVLTGFVHADPHEGNIMLEDDGRLVFLDFGLMSSVEPDIMEAFARGIQARHVHAPCSHARTCICDMHACVHACVCVCVCVCM